ncbi:MAG: hypothetical protein JXA61_02060 [Bacteroidales bacterium]|nr:hypothetical protein [Bacteroidales bacterium]
MSKTLGIDVGTNSVGWAFFDDERVQFVDMGVRIFPEGVNKEQNSIETSRNKTRRDARSARRRYYRYKLRREQLMKILDDLEMLPDETYYTFRKGDRKNHTLELFRLRKDALNKRINKKELGRIFMQMNTHRGFLSNKKEQGESIINEEKGEEISIVKTKASELQEKIDLAYKANKISHPTIGCYYYYLISEAPKNENIFNPNQPGEKIRGEGMYTLREMFDKEFEMIWAFQSKFHPELTIENKKRVKDQCIFFQRNLRSMKHLRSRCTYEFTKFKTIDKRSGKYYIKKLFLSCAPKSSFLFQEFRIWEQINKLRYKVIGNDMFSELQQEQKEQLACILDRTVKLKIGGKLDDNEKDILLMVNKLLGLPKKVTFNMNSLIGNITSAKLSNALGEDYWSKLYPKEVRADNEPILYSNEQIMLWHNIYFASNFIKYRAWLSGKFDKMNVELLCDSEIKTGWLEKIKRLKLTEEQLSRYAEITFEPDICAYSSKALRKLIPYMKQGYDVTEAAEELGYESASDIRNINENLEYRIPPLETNQLRNPMVQRAVSEIIKVVNAIVDDPRLGRPDMIRIELSRELRKSKNVRQELEQQMTKRRDNLEKYAAILSKLLGYHVDPDDSIVIKFELFLELEFSRESLNEIYRNIDERQFKEFCKNIDINDPLKFRLWKEARRVDPYTGEQIGLSRLFSSEVEIEHIIPFSRCFDNSFLNKTITTREFNSIKLNKTPLEYFDTRPELEKKAFLNRIKHFSKEKKRRFSIESDEIEGFRMNQLNNNAYIATQLRQHLLRSFSSNRVEITNGQTTAILRRIFGLDSVILSIIKVADENKPGRYFAIINQHNQIIDLLNSGSKVPKIDPGYIIVDGFVRYNLNDKTKYFYPGKSRHDHRHHAIDAAAIAIANVSIRQIIEKTCKIPDKEVVRIENLPQEKRIAEYERLNPYDEHLRLKKEVYQIIRREVISKIGGDQFREQIRTLVENMLISHRIDKRITNSGRKKVHKGRHIFVSDGDVAQGQLHSGNPYGNIQYPYEDHPDWKEKNIHNGIYVKRERLVYNSRGYFNKITQFEQIVDPEIRKIVIEHIMLKHKGDIKKALSETVYFNEESRIPIRKVRIVKDFRNLAPVRKHQIIYDRPNAEKSEYRRMQYYETGERGNYLIAIYEKPENKGKTKRDFELVSFFDAVQITKKSTVKKCGKLPLYPEISSKNQYPLVNVVRKGDMVLLYEKNPDEIDLNDPNNVFHRLYYVTGLSILRPDPRNEYGTITLRKHNEARASIQLGQVEKGGFKFGKSATYIFLLHTQFNALVEHRHFNMSLTGTIVPLNLDF